MAGSLELARAAVSEYTAAERAARCFAYFGDLPLGETWAGTFAQHRDSDSVQRANFQAISADVLERFPEDARIERASHWAVGWEETLYVRMLEDGGESVTDAGSAVLAWRERLEGYPVADDDALSEVEAEDESESWDAYGAREVLDAVRDRFRAESLEVPDDTLREWFHDLGGMTEHHGDGVYYSREDEVAGSLDWSDVLPFDTAGELSAGWAELEAEKAPYARDRVPPWESNGSASFGELT